jgi:hypothetical protein
VVERLPARRSRPPSRPLLPGLDAESIGADARGQDRPGRWVGGGELAVARIEPRVSTCARAARPPRTARRGSRSARARRRGAAGGWLEASPARPARGRRRARCASTPSRCASGPRSWARPSCARSSRPTADAFVAARLCDVAPDGLDRASARALEPHPRARPRVVGAARAGPARRGRASGSTTRPTRFQAATGCGSRSRPLLAARVALAVPATLQRRQRNRAGSCCRSGRPTRATRGCPRSAGRQSAESKRVDAARRSRFGPQRERDAGHGRPRRARCDRATTRHGRVVLGRHAAWAWTAATAWRPHPDPPGRPAARARRDRAAHRARARERGRWRSSSAIEISCTRGAFRVEARLAASEAGGPSSSGAGTSGLPREGAVGT